MRFQPFLAALLAVSASALHAQPTDTDYQIVTVSKSQLQLNVSIAGTVTPFKTVQLTAQMPGRIETIAGREGDAFTQGSVLIQLDDDALLARREAAYAAREAALAAIQNAQAQARREYYSPRSDSAAMAPGGMGMPAMMDEMFSSPMQDMMGMRDDDAVRYSDIVNVQTQVAQARTSLRQAEASIMEIDARLRDTRSVAPFAGVIEKVYVEEGDTVQPGQPIVDYSEAGRFKVEADLPVHLARSLVPGQKLPVSLENDGQPVPAQVYRIHPVADAQRHTVRVEMTLPLGSRATAGQYAEIKVPDSGTRLPPQLTIPASAVISKGGMSLVFEVGDDGTARLRVVRLGEQLDGNRVVVLSGIHDQDQIVDNPPPGLRAGTQVVPRQLEPAQAAPVVEEPAATAADQ